MTDRRNAVSIALLSNYMAGSFVTATDASGGALLTQDRKRGISRRWRIWSHGRQGL